MNNPITIGADPELFVKDSRTGIVLSAVGTVGGTKAEPVPLAVDALGVGYYVQEDNVMAEYNIPPTSCWREFAHSIVEGRKEVVSAVQGVLQYAELDTKCSRLLTRRHLRTDAAKQFGCSPDYDAYNQGMAHSVVSPSLFEDDEGGWRMAGGHVHIGYDKDAAGVPEYVYASFCDLFLGLPMVRYDKQGKRRDTYGQAGRFRVKSYGIEYRTLSNSWIMSKASAELVGRRALRMAAYIERTDVGELRNVYSLVPWGDVRKAINNEDESLADSLMAFVESKLEEDIR